MDGMCMQGEEKLLAVKQLDLAHMRFKHSFISTLVVSGLLVTALWPVVARETLLGWLVSMCLVMSVRHFDSRRYLRLGDGASIEHGKWKNRFVIGSAAAGACWGATVFCFSASQQDQATLLLMFIIVGATAFASVSMSAIPAAIVAFLLFSLLPPVAWLFSFGDRLHFFMALGALAYLGLMLLFLRQKYKMILSLLATAERNRELTGELQASNQRMTRFFESAPGYFFTLVATQEGHYAMPFASSGLRELYGLQPEEVEGSIAPLAALIHPDDLEMTLRNFGESARNRRPYHVEFRINHPSKGGRWVEARSLPHRTMDGSMRWDGFMHDISERKRMENALIEREREFHSLVEHAPDSIARYSPDAHLVYASPQWQRILGRPLDDLIGKQSHEFLLNEFAAEFEQHILAVAEDGNGSEMEMPLVRSGSEMRYHHIRFVAERDEKDDVVSVLMVGTDITTIRRAEQRLPMFMDNAPGFIYSFRASPEGHFSFPFVSAGIREICGLSPEDVQDDMTKLHGLAHPEDTPLIESAIAESAQAMTPIQLKFRVRRPGRPERWVEARSTPEREADGGIVWHGIMLDITEYMHMKTALAALDQEFRSVLQNTHDVVVRYDNECRRTYVNPAWERVNGIPADQAIGKSPRELPGCHIEPIAADFEAMLREVMGNAQSGGMGVVWQDVEGKQVCYSLTASPEFDNNGKVVSVLTVARDVSERRRMEEAITICEQESRTLIERTPDTFARYDRNCRCIFANPAFGAMVEGGVGGLLGKKPTECLRGSNPAIYEMKINEVFTTGSEAEFELTWQDKNGKAVCSHIRLTAEHDSTDAVSTVLAVGRDITELTAYRQKIHQMAFYDTLTELPNRALFNDRLRQMLTDASWHGQQAGVMLLDLDRFKTVNDTLGHPAGDILLREAAERIASCIRVYDTVARLGGDEFAILLPEIRSAEDLGGIASKILDVFKDPFVLEGKEVFVSSSLGIAVFPDDSCEPDDLVRQADSAMYLAKRSGRNAFRFYSKDLTVSANDRLTLESELRRAVKRKELELHYQPKVWLEDGRLIGSEALLRWNHPQRGMVPPDQFIGIAEDSGLIVEIGEWVLRDACRTACAWNGPDKRLHKVAINLSARQFQSNDLVNTVWKVLEETGCDPGWIELEITESLLLDEGGEVLEILRAFRSIGITIAIDDFGTGYSALSYLTRFPISTLKIDRSFIQSIPSDNYRAELVKAIISIAHCLDQEVVAEGVETAEQANFLQMHGCQVAQGYLYSKPVKKSAFELLPQSFVQDSFPLSLFSKQPSVEYLKRVS